MESKKVATIVVTFNRLTLLQEEIESLRSQTFASHQIIVINNGSTDGTLDWLKQQKDIITITQGNLGGAGGFNTGMRYAAENGYEYCWVMDDDVMCSPDALEKLVDAYSLYSNAGYICSKVVSIDGEPMNVPILDMRKGATDYTYWCNESANGLLRIQKCTFVSVLFHVSKIQELGLPYKEYFIWGDDWEYTERLSRRYIAYFCLNSVVVHKRAVQQRINIKSETNAFRLNNYIRLYRNVSYTSIKFGHTTRWKCYIYDIVKIFLLLLQFNFKEANIRWKALIQLLSFNPVVEYPQNKI